MTAWARVKPPSANPPDDSRSTPIARPVSTTQNLSNPLEPRAMLGTYLYGAQ